MLRLVDTTSEYGLTGAVFATDPAAIGEADVDAPPCRAMGTDDET